MIEASNDSVCSGMLYTKGEGMHENYEQEDWLEKQRSAELLNPLHAA